MSASAIGAFLNGAIEGRERRRRWDQENEDKDWTRNRRGRQVVVDGQQDHDRDRRIGWEDESRGRTRTEWGQADQDRGRRISWEDESRGRTRTVWGQNDEDRGRRIEEEDYTRDRTRAEHGREDEIRQEAADGYARAEQAAAEEAAIRGSVAPLVPGYEPPALAQATQVPRGRFLEQPQAQQTVPQDGIPAATPVGALPPDNHAQLANAPHPMAPSTGVQSQPETAQKPQAFSPAAAAAAQAAQGTQQPAAPAPAAPAAPAPAAPAAQAPAAPAPAAASPSVSAAITAAEDVAAAVPPKAGREIAAGAQPPAVVEKRIERASKSVMEHFLQDGATSVFAAYMRQGDVAKAEAFQKFTQSAQTKEALTHWTQAVARAGIGDAKGFASSLAAAYNTRGYFDDGWSIPEDGVALETDPETGRIYGQIAFTNDETGERYDMPFDGMQDLYRTGIGMLSPEQTFEAGWERVQEAEKRQTALLQLAAQQGAKQDDTDRILKEFARIEKREAERKSALLTAPARKGEAPPPDMTPEEMMAEAMGVVNVARGRTLPAAAAADEAGDDLPVYRR